MPNYTTSEFVYLLAGSPVSANSFTYGSSVDQIGDIEFVDGDYSGTASAGDTWGDPSITYSGYTVTVGGEDFAVFQQDDGVGGYIYYIPHDGQISASDFTSPISVTPNANATVVNCFLEGTQVASGSGSVTVETLKIGDKIEHEDGVPVPVKWIGRQTVSTRFGPAERLMPVRFAAGSLGKGLPHADLTVTADHGMLVDGVICHAGALVNGTTITRVPLDEMGETYTVYHVETEEHEIILANGAPAETFIDNVSRRVFDNFAEFEALYGDVPEMEELSYPRAMSARQVPQHIRARLSGKAAA